MSRLRHGQFGARALTTAAVAVLVTATVCTGLSDAPVAEPASSAPISVLAFDDVALPDAVHAAPLAASTVVAPYTFLMKQRVSARAVRWNPCRRLTYRLNRKGLTDAEARVVKYEMTVASRIAGIRLVFAGTTTLVLRTSTAPRVKKLTGADIVIAFAVPGTGTSRSNLISSSSAGVGGFYASSTSSGVLWATAGFAVFNRSLLKQPIAIRRSVYLHEVGHMLGLGHVTRRGEIMYPVASTQWRPTAGFVNGLRAVGILAGCSA
jgi:hypothetical protein